MSELQKLLTRAVDSGAVPGAVALFAKGDRVEVQATGAIDIEGTAPMTRDSIFRIASITKPIVAAAVMMLVEDGLVSLEDPVRNWLPELANPMVVRTPSSPVDDVVPADRPITVLDLLTSTAGYGFASDFSLPAVQALFPVQKDGREPQSFPPEDEWMAALSEVPLLYQPGEAFLYDTCSTLQGVLISRATGRPSPEFLSERIFEPLAMVDTSFIVPSEKHDRFTSYYKVNESGGLVLADGPEGQWSTEPPIALGNGGLASTVDDWCSFARMLLSDGEGTDGRLLTPASVRQMTTNHLTASQREPGDLFLVGQGWGFGGGVDIVSRDPWNIPGRYGWMGGTGTTAYIFPSSNAIGILLTQVGLGGPVTPQLLEDFCVFAANAA